MEYLTKELKNWGKKEIENARKQLDDLERKLR